MLLVLGILEVHMTDIRNRHHKKTTETDGRTRWYKKNTDGHGLHLGIPWPSLLWRPFHGEPSGARFVVHKLTVAAPHDG